MASALLLASAENFVVPNDSAFRIRLDDTLTSSDSKVGDPFSATVVEQGEYQNARVYGHIATIDISGRVKGHTSMVLRFDRLLCQMAVALRFTPKLLSSTTHPRARKSMWKVRSNPVVEGAKASRIRRLEPVLVLCWAESSAGAREL